MAFIQNDITKRFIKECDNLIERGFAKNYKEIGEALNFEKSTISNIVRGRRNLPYDAAKSFQDRYNVIILADSREDFMQDVKEELTAIRAAVKILSLKIIGLESKSTKQPFDKVSLELGEMIDKEAIRLIGELRNRS